MAIEVTETEILSNYLRGVMDRAEHHAEMVDEIALALIGAILWRKDTSTSIQVLQRDGDTKNVLWVHIRGQRYAFSYNHSTGTIEMRRGTTHGASTHDFSNATTLAEVKGVFESL